jgi:hypothetical protein
MPKIPIIISKFSGGKADSEKEGIEHSFAYSRHIDFRKEARQLSILPKTVKVSGSIADGLITEIVQTPSGKLIGIAADGGIYIRATNGTWSKDATSIGDCYMGAVYNLQHDTVYVAGDTVIRGVTDADGRFGGTLTPTGIVFGNTVDKSGGTTANTYTTTGAINEGATHKLSFTPTIEPLYSVKIWVTTKGTGDLVLTLHDGENNTLGTVTIANASLVNGALNEFVFSSQVRTTQGPAGATYHVHITHPSGTASTIGTTTASDFSTASYQTLASMLVDPINKFHPMKQFLQYIVIGNERYLTVWEPISQSNPSASEFQRHRLVFPTGYEVTSLADWTEYLAIGVESRVTGIVNGLNQGKIFFWDGVSSTYNFFIDVPEGGVYSLFSYRNTLYYFAGGAWWAWSGGQPVIVHQMPGTDFEFTSSDQYAIGYPNIMAVKNRILMAGFPSETNSDNIEHGVYSFGSRTRLYPNTFGYSYTISTGNRTTVSGDKRIGCVKTFGDKMLITWMDDTDFGIDEISSDSDPFPEATWESLIIDNGRPDKTKQAVVMKVTFETLPSGATVTPKYKIDRGAWVTGTAATAGSTEVVLNINKRYTEIQLGVDLVATTTTPNITSINYIYESLQTERD